MAYTECPLFVTGEMWDVADHNTYLRDNWGASVPDLFTTKGDLAAGTGVATMGRLAAGTNGYVLVSKDAETTGLLWYGNGLIQSGMILPIYKDAAPSGWYVCDGNNGTPDLRDRFVIGAGDTYSVDDTGGAKTINIAHAHTQGATGSTGAHTHSLGGNTGAGTGHSHTITIRDWGTGSSSYLSDFDVATYLSAIWNHQHTKTIAVANESSHVHSMTANTSSNGNHTHTNPTTASGGSTTASVMPPFRAIYFYMKS